MTAEELLAQADAAAANAYAPYSQYQVGAAVLARDGRVFAGANVENAALRLRPRSSDAAMRPLSGWKAARPRWVPGP